MPGGAARVVEVVMEFVHDDVVHEGVRAVAEGDVGEDLRGEADDRGVMVGVSNKLNAGNASSKAGHPDLTPGMPTPGQPMLGHAFGIPSFGLPPSQQNR